MQTAKTDQTGHMPRLIWVFAGHTCHFVGFVMRWLILCCWSLMKTIALNCSIVLMRFWDVRNYFLTVRNYFLTVRNLKSSRYQPEHDKTSTLTCVPMCSEDRSAFAVCLKKVWIVSCPSRSQRRLIRLDNCPGWSESSLGAQVILLVLSCSGSILRWLPFSYKERNHRQR